MAIRSGDLTISSTDGIKSIADILGVSERWGRVIVSVTSASLGSGAILYIGDSNLSNSNVGLVLTNGSGVHAPVKEFVFDQHESPGEDLYVLASDSTSIRVHVIAY